MQRQPWRYWLLALVALLVLAGAEGMARAARLDVSVGGAAVGDTGGSDIGPCSDIAKYSLDKQMNLYAARTLAACGQGPAAPEIKVPPPPPVQGGTRLAPAAFGGTDLNVHPPVSPATQSESFIWGDGAGTIVVAYDDLDGGSAGKASRSTDNGATWATIDGDPFAIGHGTNRGDPAVVYSARARRWVAEFLAVDCGGQGLATWTSTDGGVTWQVGPCAAYSPAADRNSAWIDNNPGSPFYGTLYASYNDFSIASGALMAMRSTDDGATWLNPVILFPGLRRDVQL
ncbi:MAG TPA: sialidase family protein, partial [Chloroflexia bacterium]|nr:sialidase family protein [Chloroflexia bacterium]